MDKILVILPCYNVEKFCKELVQISSSYRERFDFVFVNDCSKDATDTILKTAQLNVLSLDEHGGKSEALKVGFNYALDQNYKYIITMDSDLQHDAKDLDTFVNKLKMNPSDIIIAQRKFNAAIMPISRIMSNYLSSKIISYLSGRKISDSQCGFRLIKTDFLKLETKFHGFQYESEFLVKAIWKGAKIDFIQTATLYNDSDSSMNYIKDTFSFIRLFSYLFKQKRNRGSL